MHVLINDEDPCIEMDQILYGHDAYGNKVVMPDGWSIVNKLEYLKKGDRPFDVYAGWLSEDFFNAGYPRQAISEDGWTTWMRPV